MNLTEEEVRYVAALANLTLTEDEIARYSHDLSEVLTHIEQLNALDTSNVEPMAQVLFEGEDTGTMRPDVAHQPLSNQDALANASVSGQGYFKVPKVIER